MIWDLPHYVNNDLDQYYTVTEVNISNKSQICLVACFVVGGSRRLYNCQVIHLMQEILSTKNLVSLTIFKVTADFYLSHLDLCNRKLATRFKFDMNIYWILHIGVPIINQCILNVYIVQVCCYKCLKTDSVRFDLDLWPKVKFDITMEYRGQYIDLAQKSCFK